MSSTDGIYVELKDDQYKKRPKQIDMKEALDILQKGFKDTLGFVPTTLTDVLKGGWELEITNEVMFKDKVLDFYNVLKEILKRIESTDTSSFARKSVQSFSILNMYLQLLLIIKSSEPGIWQEHANLTLVLSTFYCMSLKLVANYPSPETIK